MPDVSLPVESGLRLLAQQCKEMAFILLDSRGQVTWWSPGAARIFDYPAEEIIGSPLARLFQEEDRELGLPEQEMALAAVDSASEDDRWQKRADGSRFWATGLLIALRDPAGRIVGYAKVLRDRTDLKEQLDTLRNRAAALEGASRHKDVFLSTLGHELRNPLGSLANAVHLIRMQRAGDTSLEPALQIVERQMHTIGRLVDDLLDLTRVQTGKVEVQRKPCVLQDIIRMAVEDCMPLVKERRHQLDLVMTEGPIDILADPDRIHQVFVNLVNNAAKYTPSGGRIWVSAATEGHEAVARVEDNGVGIPHEMLPRIFDLFTQVESSRGDARGGLGIGLALVKDLVALHGGSVQVRSEGVGKGSEFTVRLPLP